MLKFTSIIIFFANYWAKGSGQPIRTLELKGSNAQLYNILDIVNQNKNHSNNRRNVDICEENLNRNNKENKQHLKQWIKNALSDNKYSTHPIKKEEHFQIKVISRKHSAFDTRRQKVKTELRELEEMDGILRMLQKNQMIWTRV